MGTLTFTVQKDTDPAGITVTASLPDSSIDRIAASATAAHFPNGVTDPATGTVRAPTVQEIVTAIATALATGLVANGDSYAKQQAAAQAMAAISQTPVMIT